MRNQFLLLLLLPCLSYSQTWNKVVDTWYGNYASDMLLFQDSLVVVASNYNPINCPNGGSFAAFSLNGTLKWAKGGGTVITANDSFVFGAYLEYTDDALGGERMLMKTVDHQGNLIKHQEIVIYNHWQDTNKKIYPILLYPNKIVYIGSNELLVSSKSKLHKLNTDGKLLHTLNNPKLDFKGTLALDANTLFVYGTKTMYRLDAALNILDSISFGNEILDVKSNGQNLLVLFANELAEVNANFAQTQTLVSSTETFTNFQQSGNALWLQITGNDSLRLIQFENGQVNKRLSFSRDFKQTHFLVAGQQFIFSGESLQKQTAVASFTESENTQQLPDVALVGLKFETVSYQYMYAGLDTIHRFTFYDPYVTIKNNSTETLESIGLLRVGRQLINCAVDIYYRKISGLNIASGDTLTIKLPTDYREGGRYGIDICYTLVAPNGKLETILDNNKFCAYSNPTSTQTYDTKGFYVYPNPSSSLINLQWQENSPKQIELYDFTGKKVSVSQNDSEFSTQIDISGLAPGNYLIKIISEKGVRTEKIVKR
jgi:hypothetical protein